MNTTRTAVSALAGLAALSLVAAPAAAAQTDEGAASLSVLHGVPDLTVDVWVDDERTLDDFDPAELAGPLELPAGTYSLAITAADAEDPGDPVLGPVDVSVEAGGNYTAAAHLDENGEPTVSLFTNDTTPTAAGEGRVTLRHAAAAPSVDVISGEEAVITDLANGEEESLNLPAGTLSATLAPTGTTDPVLGPADVPVEEGAATIIYAWGSVEDDNLQIASQVIGNLHSSPDGVPGGLVEVEEAGTSPMLVGGLAVALGLGAVATFGLIRRR